MARPALEVADILRDHGPAWREANRGHVSLDQLKVMSAIERCRTAALGGHVARCENAACGHTEIAYNSCLMGKFRNGELATGSTAILAAFRVLLTLINLLLLSITTVPPEIAALRDRALGDTRYRKSFCRSDARHYRNLHVPRSRSHRGHCSTASAQKDAFDLRTS
jgi:hypothetical protein